MEEMGIYYHSTNPEETRCGTRLWPGDPLKASDYYDDKNGQWEKCGPSMDGKVLPAAFYFIVTIVRLNHLLIGKRPIVYCHLGNEVYGYSLKLPCLLQVGDRIAYQKEDWLTCGLDLAGKAMKDIPGVVAVLRPLPVAILPLKPYGCENARRDTERFFRSRISAGKPKPRWKIRRAQGELWRALNHMTVGTTVRRHNVSCSECWAHYQGLKRQLCGG